VAKFRKSHHTASKGLFPSYFKILLILGFLLLSFLFLRPVIADVMAMLVIDRPEHELGEALYLPLSDGDDVYYRNGFALSYNEDVEQAEWVAYELTVEHLNARKHPRTDYFSADEEIKTGSATFEDYRNSGYSKGHLVPAADRAYSPETMEETFLMSNISPQAFAFNGGIWRELEEQVRDWARSHQRLYILTGPIFSDDRPKRVGRNGVAVPDAFYKIVLDFYASEVQLIAFEIPNAKSTLPLRDYVVTVDQIEEKTGVDFFPELFTDKLEDLVEGNISLEEWPFDKKRFKTRVEFWNNR